MNELVFAGIDPGVSGAVGFVRAAGHMARVKDDGRSEALLLAVQAWERRRAG
ncbi:MAG: hypothetical protein IPG66_11810 [Hydrogenophilales bacterium]|nr:hypothetical protein [Hydrogenophilales bacterium]